MDLKNVMMQERVLKDFSAEHEVAGIVAGWRQLHIEQEKCHGHHFRAFSLPSRLWHGYLIGLRYPRRKI